MLKHPNQWETAIQWHNKYIKCTDKQKNGSCGKKKKKAHFSYFIDYDIKKRQQEFNFG